MSGASEQQSEHGLLLARPDGELLAVAENTDGTENGEVHRWSRLGRHVAQRNDFAFVGRPDPQIAVSVLCQLERSKPF
ncbi:hypothetical protein GCM10009539_24870 [Cryptosporangium japonicum]|uniref:Uncharacterized protein n=1 Tax=Cryptosporangium japonicum TaxID=80872 RepID=A0ABN0U4M4_9ACTN